MGAGGWGEGVSWSRKTHFCCLFFRPWAGGKDTGVSVTLGGMKAGGSAFSRTDSHALQLCNGSRNRQRRRRGKKFHVNTAAEKSSTHTLTVRFWDDPPRIPCSPEHGGPARFYFLHTFSSARVVPALRAWGPALIPAKETTWAGGNAQGNWRGQSP